MNAANTANTASQGQELAVIAEALYLINLMIVPGVGFLGIAWLWFTKRKTAPALPPPP